MAANPLPRYGITRGTSEPMAMDRVAKCMAGSSTSQQPAISLHSVATGSAPPISLRRFGPMAAAFLGSVLRRSRHP